MPKNKGKGGKSKRKGKNKSADGEKRELTLAGDEQQYAQVTKILGNCRVEAYCCDGKTRQCHVRGKFRKKVWINKDDIVLVGLRDYQDDKGDIIHKYSSEEARQLIKDKHIPEDSKITVYDVAEDEGNDLEEDEEFVDPQGLPGGLGMSDSEEEDDSDDDVEDNDPRSFSKKTQSTVFVPSLDDL
eukprot:CAMPEP_0184347684 /NCGR_PEP_ID=MMETSP1089-20130417/20340_1 /TAXON_ID=38269 ORGANISM="Gloeochaete wittrockiana, Strain SAG46.84" /NCGR_SAMPLE_ID=MMETSP1089 /ASSEMBLY_ACC=CAM_ASM_000445 /LENGTH=184 /DNA_ID=CAMNT_0026678909 /DNA_START=21 /DNA_END=575 /DNA_ORIENTATION=-